MKLHEIQNLKYEKEKYEGWYKRETEKNKELEEKNRELTRSISELTRNSREEVENMKEIIRWHVNPESAKYPEPQFDKFGNRII